MILCLPFIKFDYTCTIFLIHFIFFYILHYIISQRYIFLTTDFLKKNYTPTLIVNLCAQFFITNKKNTQMVKLTILKLFCNNSQIKSYTTESF